MRNSVVVFLLFLTSCLYSQSYTQNTYGGILSELYFERMPSAKSEAMGRGSAANTDGNFGSFSNPALTSLNNGFTFNTSFSRLYYIWDDAKYNYFGLSYTDKKLGSFSLSRYHWTIGPIIITNETGAEIGTTNDYNRSLYTLNYSREIIKDLYGGLNITMNEIVLPYTSDFTLGKTTNTAFSLDFGLLKRFEFPSPVNKNLLHTFQLGGTIYNVTGTKIKPDVDVYTTPLPSILRLAGSYNMKLKGNLIVPNTNDIELLSHLEYENVVNATSDFKFIIKFGQEITIGDLFSLRAGYFSQKINNHGNPDIESSFSQFTYGAGLKIPLSTIFKMRNPLSLSIDYVNLKQPTALTTLNVDKFNTISFNLNFNPFPVTLQH